MADDLKANLNLAIAAKPQNGARQDRLSSGLRATFGDRLASAVQASGRSAIHAVTGSQVLQAVRGNAAQQALNATSANSAGGAAVQSSGSTSSSDEQKLTKLITKYAVQSLASSYTLAQSFLPTSGTETVGSDD